ncbi:hypothetical protein AVEN_123040-1 [Araneus ventricosus]|uniref:Uncharacterized protein n=1 Tax=Araneus ventricosus TaxID=182803 RepID=A0A4Y2KFT9_ARAVE|nr:hypothetical protein AVEN_123040-1 [Araneus ventricosus]
MQKKKLQDNNPGSKFKQPPAERTTETQAPPKASQPHLGIAIRKTGSGNPADPASFDVCRIRHQFSGSGKLKKIHEADFLKKMLALLQE